MWPRKAGRDQQVFDLQYLATGVRKVVTRKKSNPFLQWMKWLATIWLSNKREY